MAQPAAPSTSQPSTAEPPPFLRPAEPATAQQQAPAPAAPGPGDLQWLSYNDAVAQGKEARQPILLYFNSTSPIVQKFEANVLTDAQVKDLLKRYALAGISMQNQELVQKYRIYNAPTFVILGHDGYTRNRIDGVTTAAKLTAVLKKYL
jgi:hypothetical protein